MPVGTEVRPGSLADRRILDGAGLGPWQGTGLRCLRSASPDAPRARTPALWFFDSGDACGDPGSLCEVEAGRHVLAAPDPVFEGELPGRPVRGPSVGGRPVFSAAGPVLYCRVDLPRLYQVLLSRSEERDGETDDHGRFRLDDTVLRPFLETPVLDVWDGLLRRATDEAGWHLPRVEIDGGSWHAVLTHDVDYMDRCAKRPASALGGGATARLGRRFGLGPSDGARALRVWSELERRAGWNATYYFLGQASGTRNRGYQAPDDELRREMARLRAHGHEIGLHGSYDAMDDPRLLVDEAARVRELSGAEMHGCRMHYLRARYPGTLHALAEAGFEYDASLGYTAALGFRAGTSCPFEAMDPDTGTSIGIDELPFSMMDCSFLSALGLPMPEAKQRMTEQMRMLADVGGCAVLLFHPCRLTTDGDPYDELYRHGLKTIRALDGIVLPAVELCRRFRRRTRLHGEVLGRDADTIRYRLHAPAGTRGLTVRAPDGWRAEVRGSSARTDVIELQDTEDACTVDVTIRRGSACAAL